MTESQKEELLYPDGTFYANQELRDALLNPTKDTIQTLLSLNFDLSYIRRDPLPGFETIGATFKGAPGAEYGFNHMTAQRLATLFSSQIPLGKFPNLLSAYGKRATELWNCPVVNPQGTSEHGSFENFIGLDATSLWSAATTSEAAMAIHLLACLIAIHWPQAEAYSIWSELIAGQKKWLREKTSRGLSSLADSVAQQTQLDRFYVDCWDKSARAWVKGVIESPLIREKHERLRVQIFNRIIRVKRGTTAFETLMTVWRESLLKMDSILAGDEVSIGPDDGHIVLACMAWQLYPDFKFGKECHQTNFQKDPLLLTSSLLTIKDSVDIGQRDSQTSDRAPAIYSQMASAVVKPRSFNPQPIASHCGIVWTLDLSGNEYESMPQTITSSTEDEFARLDIADFFMVIVGALIGSWSSAEFVTADDAMDFILTLIESIESMARSLCSEEVAQQLREETWLRPFRDAVARYKTSVERGEGQRVQKLLAMGIHNQSLVRSPVRYSVDAWNVDREANRLASAPSTHQSFEHPLLGLRLPSLINATKDGVSRTRLYRELVADIMPSAPESNDGPLYFIFTPGEKTGDEAQDARSFKIQTAVPIDLLGSGSSATRHYQWTSGDQLAIGDRIFTEQDAGVEEIVEHLGESKWIQTRSKRSWGVCKFEALWTNPPAAIQEICQARGITMSNMVHVEPRANEDGDQSDPSDCDSGSDSDSSSDNGTTSTGTSYFGDRRRRRYSSDSASDSSWSIRSRLSQMSLRGGIGNVTEYRGYKMVRVAGSDDGPGLYTFECMYAARSASLLRPSRSIVSQILSSDKLDYEFLLDELHSSHLIVQLANFSMVWNIYKNLDGATISRLALERLHATNIFSKFPLLPHPQRSRKPSRSMHRPGPRPRPPPGYSLPLSDGSLELAENRLEFLLGRRYPLGADAFTLIYGLETGSWHVNRRVGPIPEPLRFVNAFALSVDHHLYVSSWALPKQSLKPSSCGHSQILLFRGSVNRPGVVVLTEEDMHMSRRRSVKEDLTRCVLLQKYLGQADDAFEDVELRLTRTGYEAFMAKQDASDRYRECVFPKVRFQAHAKDGKWLGDLSISSLRMPSKPDFLIRVSKQKGCHEMSIHPPESLELCSLNSWDDVLCPPDCPAVVRSRGNETKRLTAACLLLQQGRPVLIFDDHLCWECALTLWKQKRFFTSQSHSTGLVGPRMGRRPMARSPSAGVPPGIIRIPPPPGVEIIDVVPVVKENPNRTQTVVGSKGIRELLESEAAKKKDRNQTRRQRNRSAKRANSSSGSETEANGSERETQSKVKESKQELTDYESGSEFDLVEYSQNGLGTSVHAIAPDGEDKALSSSVAVDTPSSPGGDSGIRWKVRGGMHLDKFGKFIEFSEESDIKYKDQALQRRDELIIDRSRNSAPYPIFIL